MNQFPAHTTNIVGRNLTREDVITLHKYSVLEITKPILLFRFKTSTFLSQCSMTNDPIDIIGQLYRTDEISLIYAACASGAHVKMEFEDGTVWVSKDIKRLLTFFK